jgi:Tol biopolymer transport system component
MTRLEIGMLINKKERVLSRGVIQLMKLYFLLGAFLSILICHPADGRTGYDYIPRMPDAILLTGWGPPDSMTLSMPNVTLTLLPERRQRTVSGPLIYPSMTADGKIIAGARLKSAPPRRVAIATYSVTDKKWTEYSEGEYAGSVAISLNGSKLAYPGEGKQPEIPSAMHIIDLTSGQQTSGPKTLPGARMSWSPEGSRLVYEGLRTASSSAKGVITIFDVATGSTHEIASGFAPSWSPSGDWICYFDESETRVMVVHPDGTGATRVAVIRDGMKLFPIWSPDSGHLILNRLVGEEGGVDIYMLDFATLKMNRRFQNKLPIVGWAEIKH